jgi:hypothetical protein
VLLAAFRYLLRDVAISIRTGIAKRRSISVNPEAPSVIIIMTRRWCVRVPPPRWHRARRLGPLRPQSHVRVEGTCDGKQATKVNQGAQDTHTQQAAARGPAASLQPEAHAGRSWRRCTPPGVLRPTPCSTPGAWPPPPPIDAPCTQCLRHGDPMHGQESTHPRRVG